MCEQSTARFRLTDALVLALREGVAHVEMKNMCGLARVENGQMSLS